jgi:hypothetical protein
VHKKILMLAAFSTSMVLGQSPPAADATQPGNVVFSATLRVRLYDWDWFKPVTGENSYLYTGGFLRLGLSQNLAKWDWAAEFAVPFMLDLPDNATDAAPQGALGLGSNYYTANHTSQYAAMIFPKRLFVNLHNFGSKSSYLTLGRFEFSDGTEIAPKNATLAAVKRDRVAQRLIGTFSFSDVGRSFDGLHYSWGTASNNLTVVAAVPTRGVFQVDGWGWNRIGFGYGAYTHEWGHGRHSADTRFFAIEYDDFRHILKTDNRPVAVRRGDTENIVIQTFGGHSVHVVETGAGALDFVAWGAVQTGRWGTQKQRAGALDFEAGYQPKIMSAVKPWLRGGYTWGSGDGNASDGTHGTFFQLLPTPRPYARFPFFNMMNMEDAWGSFVTRPHSKITTSSEFHSLRLSNEDDLWYSGGGAYQPWTFGFTGRATSGRRSLGNLYDTSVEYRIRPKLTATAYFGYVQGLAVMEEIYPNGRDGRFGYLELLARY